MDAMAWRILACSSCVGAEHRRRGVPGQDCVAQRVGRSRDGEPVWMLALADGHGHRRHWLSAVGSAEACRVALLTLSRWLAGLELRGAGPTSLGRWQRELAMDLTRRIHSRWLAAVRRHWRQAGVVAAGQPAPFSAEPYGCTLAVLVLTPRWWAVSGLGDWDLVGLDRHGQAALLSEERPLEPELETTASLCQVDAAAVMAARTELMPLAVGDPMALLLSSDGVRKSCGATADYLAWAVELVTRFPDQQLALQLNQLSHRGTGDDVSLLVVSHGQLTWPSGPGVLSPFRQRLPRGRWPAARRPRGRWSGRLARWVLAHPYIALASVLLLAALVLIPALLGLLRLLGS
jgi:hypothetical protein